MPERTKNGWLLIPGAVVLLCAGPAEATCSASHPAYVQGPNETVIGAAPALETTGTGNGLLWFRAVFTSGSWKGELAAYRAGGGFSPQSLVWRASAGIPAFRDRRIYTIDGAGRGISFTWAKLDAAARSALGGQAILEYIRGSGLNTRVHGGDFRNRVSLLGDIVHSAPAIAGDQGYGYGILPGDAGDSYRSYVIAKRTKPNLVVVGANDGMLHVFAADDGTERFAYLPRQLFGELAALTEPDYRHRYYVDGSPVVADAWFGSSWHTVVVATLGRGGKGIFALDITTPKAFAPATAVLWELSPKSLPTTYGRYLGEAMGSPAVVRLESGDWVALFGNGYNSDRGTAALVIVELASGLVLDVLDTGVGGDNGLGTPLAIDRDRNGSVDTVYAGDLKGHLWKFDLSSESVAGWRIAYGGQPLFTATADDGRPQPITARPGATAHPNGGVLVVFGTGRCLSAADGNRISEHSVYGIWDTEGAEADSDGSAVPDQRIAGIGALVEQTVVATRAVSGRQVRVLSASPVDYGIGDGQARGWVVDLSRPGERIIQAVRIFDGKAIMTSIVADAAGVDSALVVLNPLTGSQFRQPILDLESDQDFDTGDGVAVADGARVAYPGIVDLDVGMAMTPVIGNRADGNQTIWVTGSAMRTLHLRLKGFLRLGRASWVQRR